MRVSPLLEIIFSTVISSESWQISYISQQQNIWTPSTKATHTENKLHHDFQTLPTHISFFFCTIKPFKTPIWRNSFYISNIFQALLINSMGFTAQRCLCTLLWLCNTLPWFPSEEQNVSFVALLRQAAQFLKTSVALKGQAFKGVSTKE